MDPDAAVKAHPIECGDQRYGGVTSGLDGGGTTQAATGAGGDGGSIEPILKTNTACTMGPDLGRPGDLGVAVKAEEVAVKTEEVAVKTEEACAHQLGPPAAIAAPPSCTLPALHPTAAVSHASLEPFTTRIRVSAAMRKSGYLVLQRTFGADTGLKFPLAVKLYDRCSTGAGTGGCGEERDTAVDATIVCIKEPRWRAKRDGGSGAAGPAEAATAREQQTSGGATAQVSGDMAGPKIEGEKRSKDRGGGAVGEAAAGRGGKGVAGVPTAATAAGDEVKPCAAALAAGGVKREDGPRVTYRLRGLAKWMEQRGVREGSVVEIHVDPPTESLTIRVDTEDVGAGGAQAQHGVGVPRPVFPARQHVASGVTLAEGPKGPGPALTEVKCGDCGALPTVPPTRKAGTAPDLSRTQPVSRDRHPDHPAATAQHQPGKLVRLAAEAASCGPAQEAKATQAPDGKGVLAPSNDAAPEARVIQAPPTGEALGPNLAQAWQYGFIPALDWGQYAARLPRMQGAPLPLPGWLVPLAAAPPLPLPLGDVFPQWALQGAPPPPFSPELTRSPSLSSWLPPSPLAAQAVNPKEEADQPMGDPLDAVGGMGTEAGRPSFTGPIAADAAVPAADGTGAPAADVAHGLMMPAFRPPVHPGPHLQQEQEDQGPQGDAECGSPQRTPPLRHLELGNYVPTPVPMCRASLLRLGAHPNAAEGGGQGGLCRAADAVTGVASATTDCGSGGSMAAGSAQVRSSSLRNGAGSNSAAVGYSVSRFSDGGGGGPNAPEATPAGGPSLVPASMARPLLPTFAESGAGQQASSFAGPRVPVGSAGCPDPPHGWCTGLSTERGSGSGRYVPVNTGGGAGIRPAAPAADGAHEGGGGGSNHGGSFPVQYCSGDYVFLTGAAHTALVADLLLARQAGATAAPGTPREGVEKEKDIFVDLLIREERFNGCATAASRTSPPSAASHGGSTHEGRTATTTRGGGLALLLNRPLRLVSESHQAASEIHDLKTVAGEWGVGAGDYLYLQRWHNGYLMLSPQPLSPRPPAPGAHDTAAGVRVPEGRAGDARQRACPGGTLLQTRIPAQATVGSVDMESRMAEGGRGAGGSSGSGAAGPSKPTTWHVQGSGSVVWGQSLTVRDLTAPEDYGTAGMGSDGGMGAAAGVAAPAAMMHLGPGGTVRRAGLGTGEVFGAGDVAGGEPEQEAEAREGINLMDAVKRRRQTQDSITGNKNPRAGTGRRAPAAAAALPAASGQPAGLVGSGWAGGGRGEAGHDQHRTGGAATAAGTLGGASGPVSATMATAGAAGAAAQGLGPDLPVGPSAELLAGPEAAAPPGAGRLDSERRIMAKDLPPGYRWRKYGEKKKRKAEDRTRSYFGCTHSGCTATLHAEWAGPSADGVPGDPRDTPTLLFWCIREHNHPPAPGCSGPFRRVATPAAAAEAVTTTGAAEPADLD